MPTKKQIAIDPDIQAAAERYVAEQLVVMADHPGIPFLQPGDREQMVYECAVLVQRLRKRKGKPLRACDRPKLIMQAILFPDDPHRPRVHGDFVAMVGSGSTNREPVGKAQLQLVKK